MRGGVDAAVPCCAITIRILFPGSRTSGQDRDHQMLCFVVKYRSHKPTSMLQELLSTSTVSFSRATSRNMGGGRQWKRCCIDMFSLNVFDLLSLRCFWIIDQIEQSRYECQHSEIACAEVYCKLLSKLQKYHDSWTPSFERGAHWSTAVHSLSDHHITGVFLSHWWKSCQYLHELSGMASTGSQGL